MQVIYDNTRPAGVGSLMRVGSWDGAMGSTLLIYVAGAALIYYFFLRGK